MANRTRIEWCTHSIHPVRGLCPVDCRDVQGKPYCYARRLYKRFHWDPNIILDDMAFTHLPKRPSRIFVGSTMELFGPWVKKWWLESIFGACREFPQHTFIFLTKRPQELARWSPFPANCHIGVSVTNQAMHPAAIVGLAAIEAAVKFISYEPLLGPISLHPPYDLEGIQWVIIGACTPISARTAPKIAWIDEIVAAAKNAGIPYFLKDNLRSIMGNDLVQQFPIGVGLDR